MLTRGRNESIDTVSTQMPVSGTARHNSHRVYWLESDVVRLGLQNRCLPPHDRAAHNFMFFFFDNNDDGDNEQALTAMQLEPPLQSKVVGWRLTHEMSIPRPAPGAAASKASVKFLTTSKSSFRIRGAAATTDWAPAKAASSGVGEGAWVTYPAHTAVAMEFNIQPETAAAVAAPMGESGGDSTGAVIGAPGVQLEEGAAGVVLEWKGAGWFKGFTIYHRVEIA